MELYPTPENPLPLGAHCLGVWTADGVLLRAMYASVEASRGTVVLLGGRGDFIERYFETMRDLMGRGYAVASVDFRGQGGSERRKNDRYRCQVADFQEYDEDIRAFMTEAVQLYCPPPYFAIGHSTGGNILIQALRKRNWFSKAIAVSPLIGILYGGWPRPLVWLLVTLANAFRLGWMFLPGQNRRPLGRDDYAGNPLSGDRQRWMRDTGILEAAPQLGLGGPTFSWLKAARKSTAQLKSMDSKHRLMCPLLIVEAGLDTVVDNESMHRFADRVPGVSLVTIRESLHEILTERDEVRNQFLAIFDSFAKYAPRP
jgi:lysophospholipase